MAEEQFKRTQESQHILAPDQNYKRWVVLNAMAILVGLLGSFASVGFYYALEGMTYIVQNILLPFVSIEIGPYNLGYIIIAVIGGCIVGFITNKISNASKGSGIPEVIESAALNRGRIKPKTPLIKTLVSVTTISTSSAGREGPITLIGGGVGSFIGNKFNLKPQQIRLLIASGVSATVAGTFNAPLGGAIFSLEVLFNGIGIFSSIPVFLSSVIGAVVASNLVGTDELFAFAFAPELFNPSQYLLVALFGLIMGVIGFFWVFIFKFVANRFKLSKINAYLKPVLGAGLAGVLIMLNPNSGLLGTGYEGIIKALNDEFVPWMMIILGLLKMLSTATTIGSGNSGGVFGPSLYIGCMFGGAIGYLYQLMFPGLVQNYKLYMVIGMAALFAAAAQSPINMSIMIPELTKDFWLIPSIMLACGMSFLISWILLKRSSIYTIKLELKGLRFKVGSLFILQNMSINELIREPDIKIQKNTSVEEFWELTKDYGLKNLPVMDGEDVVGIVSKSDCESIEKERRDNVTIGDVMSTNIAIIDQFAKIQDAVDKMIEYNTKALVIVEKNDPKMVMGLIDVDDISVMFENLKYLLR